MKYAFELCVRAALLIILAFGVDFALASTSLSAVSSVLLAMIAGGFIWHVILGIRNAPVQMRNTPYALHDDDSVIHFPRHWCEDRKQQFLREHGDRVQPYDSQVGKL